MIEVAHSETNRPPAGGPAGLPRAFWALFAAAGSSGVGNGVALVAFPLLASRLTDTARLVSAVLVAETLPNLANLYVGALLDRVDKRRLVVAIEWFRAALQAAFAAYVVVVDRPSIVVLLVTVFLLGLGGTIVITATQVIVPEIVEGEELGRANGWLGSVEAGAELMAGQALGGWLIAVTAALPFVFDSLTFVASAILLAFAVPRRARDVEREGPTPSVHADIRDGVRHFRSDQTLQLVAGVIATFAFCQALVFGVLVIHLQGAVGLGDAGIGVVVGVGAVGGVLGGVFAGSLDRRLPASIVLNLAGIVVVGGYVAMAYSSAPVVAALALFAGGVCVSIGNVASITIRQRVVPPELAGRTMGFFRFVILSVFPLGALIGGVLADLGTTKTSLLLAAGVQLLVLSVSWRRLHAVVTADERLAKA